jgi:imidazolonepropionase-like amidohydrolase
MRICFSLLLVAMSAVGQEAILIKNATIHPVVGADIPKGQVLIVGDRIKEVGVTVKAGKARVIDASGLHLYPGLIDSGTTLGLEEVSAVRETLDLEELGEFNPQLRALIAVNPSSDHINVTRANGVTNAISMIRGGTIGGQSALLHLDGWTWEQMMAKSSAGTFLNFPAIRTQSYSFMDGASQRPFSEVKKQYDEKMKSLREFFDEARRYQKLKDAGGPSFKVNNRLEAMLPILERQTPMMVSASSEREIKEAIEFAEQQKIKIMVGGVREPGKALDMIAEKKIPVILGPTFTLPNNDDDPYDTASALPKKFAERGVLFSFASYNSQFARNLPYQAANAVAFGLTPQQALEALTINPARIWGVEDQLGSITAGKLANLVLADGDILESRTTIKQLFIKGKSVPLTNRHVELYEKYKARPTSVTAPTAAK